MSTAKTAETRARALLNRPAPEDYIAAWTAHAAAPKAIEQRDWHTAMVFRLGTELLALPAAVVREVAEPRPIHTLPHRRDGAVLGVINVRGELIVCVDLPKALGFAIEAVAAPDARTQARFLVLRRDTLTVAFRADDVLGVHRFFDADLQSVPATIAKAAARYSQSVFDWQGKPVGYLDDHAVFTTLKRSLA
jgi:chemotaxis-related protein WspD